MSQLLNGIQRIRSRYSKPCQCSVFFLGWTPCSCRNCPTWPFIQSWRFVTLPGGQFLSVSLGRWGQLESDCVLSAPLRSCQGKKRFLVYSFFHPIVQSHRLVSHGKLFTWVGNIKPLNLANPFTPTRIPTVGNAYLEDHVEKFSEVEVGLWSILLSAMSMGIENGSVTNDTQMACVYIPAFLRVWCQHCPPGLS